MMDLLSDLRLTPAQRREIYTNTFLEHDCDGAVAALRFLHPSVYKTDVPFIRPATSRDKQHNAFSRKQAARTFAFIKEGVLKA